MAQSVTVSNDSSVSSPRGKNGTGMFASSETAAVSESDLRPEQEKVTESKKVQRLQFVAQDCNKSRLCRAVEVAVLVVIIAAIWGLASLPSVFFFRTATEEDNTNQSDNQTSLLKTMCLIIENFSLITDLPPMKCSRGFINVYLPLINASQCHPHCPSWELYPHSLSVTFDAILITVSAVNVIASIVVVLLSIARYKRMFKFPTVFILYQTASAFTQGVVSLISFTDRATLFCGSPNWLVAFCESSSTPFCKFSGAVLFYITWQLGLWWLFHIVSVFVEIKFPFQARSLKASGRIKYIHIVLVAIGVFFPVIPVIVLLQVGGFSSRRFPPYYCSSADGNVAFYSTFLPLCVILAIGASLMVGMLWIIISRYIGSRHKASRSMDKSTRAATLKLLVLFCYIMALGVFDLTWFTVATNDTNSLRKALFTYFRCEGAGESAECNLAIDFRARFSLSLISFSLYGIYPVFCLLYAVNIPELREKLSKCIKCVEDPKEHISQQFTQRSQSTITTSM